jgi:hypothetical protein
MEYDEGENVINGPSEGRDSCGLSQVALVKLQGWAGHLTMQGLCSPFVQ